MFVAGRHIKIERDGEAVDIGPGEPVPEAATWPHDVLMRCMKIGQVVNVAEDEKVDAVTAPMAAKSYALAQTKKATKKSGKGRAA
jgi:hypothetical protein